MSGWGSVRGIAAATKVGIRGVIGVIVHVLGCTIGPTILWLFAVVRATQGKVRVRSGDGPAYFDHLDHEEGPHAHDGVENGHTRQHIRETLHAVDELDKPDNLGFNDKQRKVGEEEIHDHPIDAPALGNLLRLREAPRPHVKDRNDEKVEDTRYDNHCKVRRHDRPPKKHLLVLNPVQVSRHAKERMQEVDRKGKQGDDAAGAAQTLYQLPNHLGWLHFVKKKHKEKKAERAEGSREIVH